MKPIRQIHDPYHNPFHNRFRAPVNSRLDEMQAHTHMVWLSEPAALEHQNDKDPHSRHWATALAGLCALVLVVVVCAAILSH